MTRTTLTRRHFLIGTTAVFALGSVPGLALANSDALLADILVGVGDALMRDWIRDNYGRGRWDGRYWVYEGRRYTPHEYRDYWLSHYQPPPPPPARRPAAPPPRPAPGPGPGPKPQPPKPPAGGRGPDHGPGNKPGNGPKPKPGDGPGNGPGNGPGKGPGPR